MSNQSSLGRLSLAALAGVVLVLVTVGVVAIGGPAAADGGGEPSAGIGVEALDGEIDPDDVLLAVELDGEDAAWTIEYRTRLETDDERAAFEDLQDDIEADPEGYTATFHDRMNATADDAATATGREMAISEMAISAERTDLPQEYGVVRYTFRWSNFAAIDDDGRLTAGDAIDGLFLDDASALRVGWSDEWALGDATPEPTETRGDAVVWQGPTSFADGEPRIVLDPIDPATEPPGDDATDDGVASDGDVSATTLALVAVLLGSVLVVFGARRGWFGPIGALGAAGTGADGSTGETDATPAEGEDGAGTGGAAAASGSTPGGSDADDAGGPTAGDDDDVAATDEDTDGDAAAEDGEAEDGDSDPNDAGPFGAGVDPELLSNEEKVLRLIEANGGRMKQKRVAEELDWTAAKTSQVTKRLREDGDLKGFRLGRENVLALPEEDPR